MWRYREVLKNFVAQDLKVKYRRSILGFFWSLLNPLLQMIVLSTVFSLIFRMESFSLYLLAGLVPWTFFAATVDGCSMSIVSAENLIKRQYFPKILFPLSVTLQNLVTFALSLFALLLILGWIIGFDPSRALLILPLSFLCLLCVGFGVGALASVLTVYFRDMQHLIGVFMMVLFYFTPIIYPLEIKRPAPDVHSEAPQTAHAAGVAPSNVAHEASADPEQMYYKKPVVTGPIPHQYRFYFKLNPMYAIMEMFHRPIYDNMLPTRKELAAAVAISLFCLVGGLAVFWRYENKLIFAL
jgi:ABC-type polysaccharide/polyol phosphate export permease